MTDADGKRDFRYTLGDRTIEAYQITPATRFNDKEWPDWLRRQRLPDEPNTVYINTDDPNRLWLTLPTGDVQLPELAWIVKEKGFEELTFIEAEDMETYTKVVPIMPRDYGPPADGMPDESHLVDLYPQHVPEGKTKDNYRRKPADVVPPLPVASVQNISGDVTEMRNEMLSAIKLLKQAEEQADNGLPPAGEEALDYLIAAMAKRTRWCDCPPGVCNQEDDAGCRINSPLVK